MTVTSETPTAPPFTLADRYAASTGRVQLTGIQALVRLPVDQHRRDLAAGLDVGTFVSGYEGSPLAGFDLELTRNQELLDHNDVVFVPGLNEEAAATAVQGSQLVTTVGTATRTGVLGIWYGKAPGLDRAGDALRHGNLIGAHPYGGALVLVGDDPAAKSSSVPCASDLALVDLAMPFLAPADSQDVLDLGAHAIALSRASGLWVGLKVVTAVADGSSTVDLSADPEPMVLPAGSGRHQPTARLLQPVLGPLERDLLDTRLRIAREYAALNRLNRIVAAGPGDRIGIVAPGRTWLELRAALDRLGLDEAALEAGPVRLLWVRMPWPLEEESVTAFAEGLEQIVVVEEKRSFLESAIRDVLYGTSSTPVVVGKRDHDGAELMPAYGELDADVIVARLHRVLGRQGILTGPDPDRNPARAAGRTTLPMLARAPYFCSGCPHNSSTKPPAGPLTGGDSDSLVGAGIGCHAMVLLMDERQVGTVTGLTQMGGEGLHWIGMAPFQERRHYVQNLGDGTFDHSGSLAVRAAVAAGIDITYRLLYNGAVAMTGGQRPVGGMDVRQIVDVLLAERVSRIIVTTEDRRRYRGLRLPRGVEVWDRRRIEGAMRVLAATPGVTVLLHDQECATQLRRRRRRGTAPAATTSVVINERVCEGCGDCGRVSNCLSVHPVPTEYGRKTRIHQASCNADYSCLDGDCPAFMTVRGGRGPTAVDLPVLDAAELPEPNPVVGAEDFGVRLAGIGGTGVVTVSQVLATAGLLAGWSVRSLDQTGLAQKGGAVVSDVRFSRRGAHGSNRLAAGECDLYLGCDVLVAADPRQLSVAAPERTLAVVSTARVPTGHMVADASLSFPSVQDALSEMAARVRGPVTALDAQALATGLLGDDQFANLLLLGVGYQRGGIPLPAMAIEEAIRLNGVAVERNLQAFRRGRQYVCDPEAVLDLAHSARTGSSEPPVASDPPGEADLERLVRSRREDLVAYQSAAYARRYVDLVARVRLAEEGLESTELTEQVARNLYKLMAYKDEYEVARLCLDPTVAEEVQREFGADARVSWRLHPPMLRALGLRRKLRLGRWFRPVLWLLARMRFLRGTPFDPFGRTHLRGLERSLVDEYAAVVDRLAARLGPATHELAVEIAALPDLVRGYEQVKLANVQRYRQQLAVLMDRHDEAATETPR